MRVQPKCSCGGEMWISYSYDLQRARLECQSCGKCGEEVFTSPIWRNDPTTHAVQEALIRARTNPRGEAK